MVDSPESSTRPAHPVLFLIDGYALIYRAFFALLSRPLTTARGENTSAAWGVVNFLQRLLKQQRPDYVGWVHDSGLSFRNEMFPDYKATREKLSDELQADFDRGIGRIEELLDAYRVPVLSVPGYEADDVIGTLARQGREQGVEVVIVSGDKDFQQLVRNGVWLLNPGRGGPAAVDEHWVGPHNANERLGVPPGRVVDYLALVGDSSDNVPGVPGIGEKTARALIERFGGLESILASAGSVSKKRPREALLASPERARLSRRLVTIRDDAPITIDLPALRTQEPDGARLRRLFVELEFTSLLRDMDTAATPVPAQEQLQYRTVGNIEQLIDLVEAARRVGRLAFDTETVPDPGAPEGVVDPLRSRLVGISIALKPREAYYLPLAHRSYQPAQGELLTEASPVAADVPTGSAQAGRRKRGVKEENLGIAERLLRSGPVEPVNLPALDAEAMNPLRELLADASVGKVAQNAKFDLLVMRRAGVEVRGMDFDTMIASYVLDPGRRSHGLDLLALEFLDHQMMRYQDLCGRGRNRCRSMSCQWMRRATTRVRTQTSRSGSSSDSPGS